MLETIQKYRRIIKSWKITLYEIEGTNQRVKAFVNFIDGSRLDIKDYIFEDVGRKYAFNWVRKDNTVIVRWDNAEHWTEISTFPHHKHIGEKVELSTEVLLEDVLEYIKKRLHK